MEDGAKLEHWPATRASSRLTRREFIPQMAAALLGAGALLNPQRLLAQTVQDTADAVGMKYRTLGKTGIEVSAIGFGSHLNDAAVNNPLARTEHIRKGLELGINLFDIYDHGLHQFAPMGEILGPVRQQVVISLITTWEQRQVLQEVEYALKTLGTDYIDLYRIYAETGVSNDEVETRFQALQQAKKAGKIRAVGLVAHDHVQLAQMLRAYPELDYLKLPYNFRHQQFSPVTAVQPLSWDQAKAKAPAPPSPEEVPQLDGLSKASSVDCQYYPCPDSGLLSLVRQTGVGLIAIKTFAAGGLLQLGLADPLIAERLQHAELSLPQAALRFVLDAPEISSAIPSMNSVDEVVENVGAVQSGMSQAETELLQLWAEAAERAQGSYLPAKYAWLEQWKA